jgi:mono/diheme cytochrome c family protein
MQFLLVPQNGPEKFREWEEDFRSIAAYLESLEPPPYPFGVDQPLAAQGRTVFNRKCASCHGSYGDDETYPGKIVSIDKVGTDRVRLDALTADHRRGYANSWFGEYGRHGVNAEPAGYVAPPLDGIWATAPYLHNGSIPTLWHLFHADQRPTVWNRIDDSLDQARQGLHIEAFAEVPKTARSLHQRRQYFDTRKRGKSAVGHLFPDRLDEKEKRAVLEYLKTL